MTNQNEKTPAEAVEKIPAYAIVEVAGKSVRVEPGRSVVVDTRFDGEKGAEVTLDKVLLVRTEDGVVRIGKPTVAGVTIKATIAGEQKGPKLVAFRKRRRKGFMKKKGHRQTLTRLEIGAIAG
jgi:large subunit ribosomal protein L21